MNQHLQGNESGLIAYYRLDEAGGRVVRDSTARGHDGVLSHFDAVLPITGLFNTGVDDDGVLLFQRQADPHYTVALSAGTADSGTVIDADGFRFRLGSRTTTIRVGSGCLAATSTTIPRGRVVTTSIALRSSCRTTSMLTPW